MRRPSKVNESSFVTVMPHYKLVDYSYPTSGELARLIFQYKDIPYEDEKVESPDRIYEAEEGIPFAFNLIQ